MCPLLFIEDKKKKDETDASEKVTTDTLEGVTESTESATALPLATVAV
jgi:hypothetical protein